MAMFNFEPWILPPVATLYGDNRHDGGFPSQVQSHVPKSSSPEAPPDNRSFYPAKHLAYEFELMRKHNPRAIAQRASVGLNSLPDSTRNLPWAILITAAILGSPQQRLRLAEIQEAVALRFGFLVHQNITNSFRDTLSKNKKFGRMPRPRGEDRLLGAWWFVVDHPPVQVEPRPVPSPRPDPLPPFHKFLLAISGPVHLLHRSLGQSLVALPSQTKSIKPGTSTCRST
ncbi:hypothetical protein JB92DRAFT_2998610 [Gautieria morchelliformis]|nr:hypothetical protein JB92DRAFT_2998610 [Gautieria morchelliformis]